MLPDPWAKAIPEMPTLQSMVLGFTVFSSVLVTMPWLLVASCS